MTIDERQIADELRLMASEAAPVDPLAYGDTAITAASRGGRRRTWAVTGLAGLAAAATVAAVLLAPPSDTRRPDAAARLATLPDNTPEQSRLVRECLPDGGPVHGKDSGQNFPVHGPAAEFRLLAAYRDQAGMTFLAGSDAGFVVCTPIAGMGAEQRPVFTYWGFETPGDVTGFSGDLQVDAYTAGRRQVQRDEDLYLVVAGRVSDAVRRVEVDWADGRRADAVISHGFFIVRIQGRRVPSPDGRPAPDGRRLMTLGSPPVTVTAYGAGGRVLRQEKDVTYRPPGQR
jgi:hypothetical protein